MANEQNLVPLSTSKAREIGKKGGLNSGISRREKKLIKEQLKMLMSLEITDDNLKEQIKALGIEESEITIQMAICVALAQQALQGNIRAFEIVRDTMGEFPTTEIEHQDMIVFVNDLQDIDYLEEEQKKEEE